MCNLFKTILIPAQVSYFSEIFSGKILKGSTFLHITHMKNLNLEKIIIMTIIALLIFLPSWSSLAHTSSNGVKNNAAADQVVMVNVGGNSGIHKTEILNGNQTLSGTSNISHAGSRMTPFIPLQITGPADTNLSVNPQFYYSSEPAPMGIADYGLSTNGPSGYNSYSYSTPSFLGKVNITSLSTDNASNSSVGTEMSFQMNVNLEFYNSGNEYDYWIQDVAFVQTYSPQSIQFIDNVWNFSSQSAEMHNSTIQGNGTVAKSGFTGFYYDLANLSLPGNDISMVYPTEFQLKVVSEINEKGNPEVLFEYNDGYGWVLYDQPSFVFATHVTSDLGFTVNGSSYNPFGTYYDAELIMGGPGGGTDTKDIASNLSLKLQYWNGHNYQMISNAFNHGSDTAEGISNVISTSRYYTATGSIFAKETPGSTKLGEIYNYTDVGVLNLSTVLKSGNLSVGGRMHEFKNYNINLTLGPGNYNLDLYNSSNPNLPVWSSTVNISAGSYISMNANGFYNVTFSETGLPAGTDWYVNITGARSSGKLTSDTYTVYLPNGTYYYNISTTLKTYRPFYNGSFEVTGANIKQPTEFKAVKYTIIFKETGLPEGTRWYINGTTGINASSTDRNISLSLTNGTYYIDALNLSSFYAQVRQYKVTVAGSNITETVLFEAYSHIYVRLSPPGAILRIDGKEVNTTSGYFNAAVENGTYEIVVSMAGYTTYYQNLSIRGGNSTYLNISLNRSLNPQANPFRTNPDSYYYVGSLVAIISLAGIGALYARRRR